MLGNTTAEHNVRILGSYNNFFNSLERGICYAVVLSLTTLFEVGKKKQTLDYLANEAAKFKIDIKDGLATLRKKHTDTLNDLEDARNTFFAHREKGKKETQIPSCNKLFSLLNDTAKLLNTMGANIGSAGETYAWNNHSPGWSKDTEGDFQRILDNLYRGEIVRLAEIEVKYGKKLYDTPDAPVGDN